MTILQFKVYFTLDLHHCCMQNQWPPPLHQDHNMQMMEEREEQQEKNINQERNQRYCQVQVSRSEQYTQGLQKQRCMSIYNDR